MRPEDGEQCPAIISIGAGTSQLPLIRTAKKLGWHVIAVDRNPNAPGFAHADVGLEKSTYDTEPVVAALDYLCGRYRFQGVVARTTAAEALLTATTVAKRFGLPGLTKELVLTSTEKSALRKFGALHDLPVPEGIRANINFDGSEIADFPVIVKPDSTRVGKAGIQLCRSQTTLEACIAQAIGSSSNQWAEVGSYVKGIDVTCLCWAHRGRAIIVAWWDEIIGIDADDQIIGLGVSVPSVISGTDVKEKAERIVARLVTHFPTADALLLVSFRITLAGDLYIIELHADLGGDLIADVLLPAANPKFDFFKLAIQVATSNIQDVEQISFNPTTLYYLAKSDCSDDRSGPKLQDYVIMRHQTVRENLRELRETASAQGFRLSIWPLHLEWLRRYPGSGA